MLPEAKTIPAMDSPPRLDEASLSYSETLMATEILAVTIAGRVACMVAAENQCHEYFWPTITNSFVRVSEPCSRRRKSP
jgi:hypothetical protein